MSLQVKTDRMPRYLLDTEAVDTSSSSDNRIQVEFPAAFDRKDAIKWYKKLQIDPETSPGHMADYQRELENLEQCDKSPVIGTVIYGSGMRKNQANRRMDWALIETPHTYSVNVPTPDHPFFLLEQTRQLVGRSEPVRYSANANSQVRAIGDLDLCDWVCKMGRSSLGTSGQVNRLRREIKWEGYDHFITQEIEVFGLRHDFVDPGDKGAWVTNRAHELVGVLMGMDPFASAAGPNIGFVTDIRDIEQDVRAISGGATFALPTRGDN